MPQKSKRTIAYLICILLLTACGSSNNVVSNRLIQKRKFNKGWHINSSQTNKRSGDKALVEEEKRDFSESNEKSSVKVIDEEQMVVESSLNILETSKSDEVEMEISVVGDSVNQTFEVNLEENESKTEIHSVAKRIQEKEEIDYVKQVKKDYRLSWMFTVIALVTILAGILLFGGSIGFLSFILGVLFIGIALTAYVFMFIYLTKTAIGLVKRKKAQGMGDRTSKILLFLVWAHILIGSFVSILFFWIPLIAVLIPIISAKRNRR